MSVLRDPIKARFLTVGLVLCIGYMFIYSPMRTKIIDSNRLLDKEKSRGATVREIRNLREEIALSSKRVMSCKRN